jgi:Spy/CpxP family protein refolding chaperone
MTKYRLSLPKVAAILLGTLAVTAVAQEYRDPFEGMGRLKRLLRGAELTQAQLAQVVDIRNASREQEEQLSDSMRTLRDQFDEKFTSTAPLDVAALTALHEQVEQIAAVRDRVGFENMLKIRALLQPEQLARVDETHQRMTGLDAEMQSLPPTIAGDSSR